MEGTGSVGVKGEQFFSVGLCSSWSVSCPVQLGDLDQFVSDGKDHLFIEQPATGSMAMQQT